MFFFPVYFVFLFNCLPYLVNKDEYIKLKFKTRLSPKD